MRTSLDLLKKASTVAAAFLLASHYAYAEICDSTLRSSGTANVIANADWLCAADSAEPRCSSILALIDGANSRSVRSETGELRFSIEEFDRVTTDWVGSIFICEQTGACHQSTFFEVGTDDQKVTDYLKRKLDAFPGRSPLRKCPFITYVE